MKYFNLIPLIIILITLISCSNEEDEIHINDATSLESVSYSELELDIFLLVNDHRDQQGLPQLSVLNTITNEAIEHSNYMVEKGVPSHDNFSQRISNLRRNSGAINVSENVAYGYNTAQAVVSAWLRSDAHRTIIENEDFTDFGLSMKEDHHGKKYYTHIFIKR